MLAAAVLLKCIEAGMYADRCEHFGLRFVAVQVSMIEEARESVLVEWAMSLLFEISLEMVAKCLT